MTVPRLKYISLPWAKCRMLSITATIPHGVVLPVHYPATLDGVLASAAHRRRLGASYGLIGDTRIEALPLATSHRGPPSDRPPDCGNRWVFAATSAIPVGNGEEDLRWYHQRFNQSLASRVVTDLPASTDTGRYKPWRMPLVVTLVDHLQWWALGDRAGVEDLLGDVSQVGAKRSQGEGAVSRWEVSDEGEPEWDRVLWTDTGHPARPLPVRAAPALGLHSPDTLLAAYRPPYWRPRLVSAAGEWSRQWQEVIAPWVTRPVTSDSASGT